MMKPDISIFEHEFINSELCGHHFSVDPTIKVLKKVNELGLEGKKIVEIQMMRGYDMDVHSEVVHFYFKTENVAEVHHGNGD